MPVSFNSFPSNWRLPLYWLEVDPSQAGTLTLNPPALVVGQMLPAGSAPPDVPVAIGTLAQAKNLFGEGSMLERMFARFFDNNLGQIVYGLPLADPVASLAAGGSIQVSAPPSDAGIISLYIGGQRAQVLVGATDTAAIVATSMAAAINAIATMPVTATAATDTVTLACKWKGATGNDIDLRDSYLGTRGGEALPPGLTLTYTAMANGAGMPDFTNAIANLGDEIYDYVAMPFTDTASLDAWEAEYGFGDTGRWGWMRQLYGMVFSAYRAIFSDMITWGQTNNAGTLTVMAFEPDVPSPMWECAAAYCAKAARAFTNDPARPLQTLELAGIKPAPKHLRFVLLELNDMASSGLATQSVDPNGLVMILRDTTTYQVNIYNQSDDAYELATTLFTLSTLFRRQKQAITSKYPRHKLADDDTRFGVGQAIVTPKIIKGELIAEYATDQFDGLVENTSAFKANLIVERDDQNPNRVNVLYPPDLINQLRIFAVLAQFRLQYPDASVTAVTG